MHDAHLLRLIFSYIDNYLDLLVNTYLVCRAWHSVDRNSLLECLGAHLYEDWRIRLKERSGRGTAITLLKERLNIQRTLNRTIEGRSFQISNRVCIYFSEFKPQLSCRYDKMLTKHGESM